jgi:lipoprotein signal peptidase
MVSGDYASLRTALARNRQISWSARLQEIFDEGTRTRLRWFVFIVFAVFVVDWGSSWLVDTYFTSAVIVNPRTPPLEILYLMPCGFAFLALVIRNRVGAISAGLCCGGSLGNTIARVVCGPVVDFINEPFRAGGWVCNPADICIWTGSLLMLIALAFSLRDHWRWEREVSARRRAERAAA